ncbi:MAG: ECF transporter S component [Treponema sp.]|nr:ECF transporter S component [Treponema sp.]
MKRKNRLALPEKIHPAVISVWAAVVAAAHLIPAIPMLGTGSNFSFASALSPLSGILFGPIAGALCSAAGGFIGSLVAPHTAWMGLWTFIIGTVTAFTTGCIAWGAWPPVSIDKRGSFIINGGIIVYLIGTLLWFSQETGRRLPLFPLVYYSAGFIAYGIGSVVSGKLLAGNNTALKFPAIWLCAFGGMVGGATIGNFFSLVLYDLPKETWFLLTFTAPVERTIFSIGTALVGVPLLTGLHKIGIFAGPQPEADKSVLEPPEGTLLG